MAEPERVVVFGHKEIVEELIRKRGIREGIWRLYVEFALGAANAGPSPEEMLPTAFVGIKKIGILRVDALDALAVDAAVVNPPSVSPRRRPKPLTSERARPSSRSPSA